MVKEFEKIKTLFRLYMVNSCEELGSTIKKSIDEFQRKNISTANNKLFVELFTSLLPIYAANKKSYHHSFIQTIEINIALSKIIKIETVDLLKRIIRIVTNLLVDLNKTNGQLKSVNQNDTIRKHIIALLNSIIAENDVVFRLLLEDHSSAPFYGYICATVKLMIETSTSTPVYEECVTFFNLGPKYLVEQSTVNCASKKKIAKSVTVFLPGVLSALIRILKNESHFKFKLKLKCLHSFYYYLGVLLDDRWVCLQSIGDINSEFTSEEVEKNNNESTQSHDSTQRIASLMVEITNLVWCNRDHNMCRELGNIVDYHYRNCQQLNLTQVLLDISTRLLTTDFDDVCSVVSSCLNCYSSTCDKNKFQIITYFSKLFKKSSENILKHQLNVVDNLKLIQVCLRVIGNDLCVSSELLKDFLEFLAKLIRNGYQINSSSSQIKLFNSDGIVASRNNPAPIQLKQVAQTKQSLEQSELDLIENILHLMLDACYFTDITSLCVEFIENQSLFDYWSYLYIINCCLKILNKSGTIATLTTTHNVNINYLYGLIETVHDFIFGDQQNLFRQLYSPHQFTPQYLMAMQELGICIISPSDISPVYCYSTNQVAQMCFQVFNFVKESSQLLSTEYIYSYFIRTLYILLTLRCTLASFPVVCEASFDCLTSIARNMCYENLSLLVMDFKEVIIDEISLQMRYLSWNNNAPVIFKSLVTIVEGDSDQCFRELVEPLVEVFMTVVENYQDEGFLYCYTAIYAYVEFMLKFYKPTDPHYGSNSFSTNKRPYEELYPALNDNESLLEFYKKHISKSCSKSNAEESDVDKGDTQDEEESLQKCPAHLQLVYNIMAMCTHFLNSKSETLQVMIHQLCCKCIMVFDRLELVIYPLMHKLWDPLLYSIKNHVEKNDCRKHSLSLASSVRLLGVMCQFSGTFLKGRVVEQFFPIIQKLYSSIEHRPCNLAALKNIVQPISTLPNVSFIRGNRCEFEVALIQLIPKLIDCFDLKGVQLNFLTYCCVKFIQQKFPSIVKQEAVKSLYKLTKIEPYTMKLLNSVENRLNWDKLFCQYYVKD